MTNICRVAIVIFGTAWVAAIALLLIGTFGWFGQEKDPLSGIFLMPLGLPWNLFLDGLPNTMKPWGATFAPGINLALLMLICGVLSRKHHQQQRH